MFDRGLYLGVLAAVAAGAAANYFGATAWAEDAEFEISKKVANMENPFEPSLPMPPVMIAIDNETY